MTAEEAYAGTLKAKRDYVLDSIENAVGNCNFKTIVWQDYIYAELENELTAAGYAVSRERDKVTISWEAPAKKAQQTACRAVSFG